MNEVPTKLARPVAAAFRFPRVEQDEVLARLGLRMVAIGRVKVADMIGGIAVGRVSHAPANVLNIGGDPVQFDPRRAEERHREIAAQIHAVVVVPDDIGRPSPGIRDRRGCRERPSRRRARSARRSKDRGDRPSVMRAALWRTPAPGLPAPRTRARGSFADFRSSPRPEPCPSPGGETRPFAPERRPSPPAEQYPFRRARSGRGSPHPAASGHPSAESAATASRPARTGDRCSSPSRRASASRPCETTARTGSAPTSGPRPW